MVVEASIVTVDVRGFAYNAITFTTLRAFPGTLFILLAYMTGLFSTFSIDEGQLSATGTFFIEISHDLSRNALIIFLRKLFKA